MYDITMTQIEIFLLSAQRLSFSKAAEELFITPSAVSKSVKSLEKELGMELFTRYRKKLSLTRQGELLLAEWRVALDSFGTAVDTARQTLVEDSGELRIGCLHGFDYNSFLPELIASFEREHPQIHVSIAFHGFRELRESLISNETDLILTADFSLDGVPNITSLAVEEIPLYIAISHSHPLAGREQLNLSDLKDEVFYQISPEETAFAVERAVNACKKAGFTPKEIRYVPNIPSLAMAVKQGKGVTICGDEMYRGNEKFIRLYSTAELPPDAYTTLAWKASGASISALRFIEHARTKIR